MFINKYHYIDLEIRNVDYVFIFIDIDMDILEINSESMFISIMIKKTQKNTNHCVSTGLSVFDCALFVQVIHEVASDPRSGYNNFCKFGFTCLLHDLTSYTEKH